MKTQAEQLVEAINAGFATGARDDFRADGFRPALELAEEFGYRLNTPSWAAARDDLRLRGSIN